MNIKEFLELSKTQYQAIENSIAILNENNFTRLYENEKWNLQKNGKYFVVRDNSSLIAFDMGENFSFNVVASHSDSPCFKIKLGSGIDTNTYVKLNVERYGGGILYSFLDRPLKVAGRIIVKTENGVQEKNVVLDNNFVIPSVAIHFNRTVNEGLKLNAQVDMCPLVAIGTNKNILLDKLNSFGSVLDYDLYLVSDEKPFENGFNNEFLSSPRIDNLTSAFSSLQALIMSNAKAINLCFIADNEEVGSRTKQGAGSKFLIDTVERIAISLNKNKEELMMALNDSMILSVDNAHALHPNHPELSDPTNKTVMGNGIVIKHHANCNYTTDGKSSACIKYIFDKANVKYQDFFMRSDLGCGGTLGAISSSQLSILSVDIGIGQLAMHSAVETMAMSDYYEMEKAIKSFYSCKLTTDKDNIIVE